MATKRETLEWKRDTQQGYLLNNIEVRENGAKAKVRVKDRSLYTRGNSIGFTIAEDLFNRWAREYLIPSLDQCYYYLAVQGPITICETTDKLDKFTMEVINTFNHGDLKTARAFGVVSMKVKIWDQNNKVVLDYSVLHTEVTELEPSLFHEFFPYSKIPEAALRSTVLPIPPLPPDSINYLSIKSLKLTLTARLIKVKRTRLIISKGYHKELGMSSEEYKNSLPNISWNTYLLQKGFNIFLLVDPRIPGPKQYELVTGKESDVYRPLVGTPDKPYWAQLRVTSYGNKHAFFEKKEPWESGLIDAEGPAIRLQLPYLLKKGVILAGSVHAPQYKDFTQTDYLMSMWGLGATGVVVVSVGARLTG